MGFHPSHPMHELELSGSHKPYNCDGCMELGFGSRYGCRQCDFDLHPACMFPAHDLSSSHDFFPNSHFKFLKQPPRSCHDWCKRYCDACAKPIHGFLYHCEKDRLDLHPCCRNLKKKCVIEDVVLTLHEKVRSKCIWCKKKEITHSADSGVKGWSYISDCGKYHFHVACVTEMVWEELRGGKWNGEALALEKVDLKAIQSRGKRGHRGNKYWRIVKVFFKTIACVLLGDPTITLACLFVDLLV